MGRENTEYAALFLKIGHSYTRYPFFAS